MTELKSLLKDLVYNSNCNLEGVRIKEIKCDSRLVKKEDLFVALKGCEHDGHEFIDEAVKNGAKAVVANTDYKRRKGPVFISFSDTTIALPVLARNFYEDPSKKIDSRPRCFFRKRGGIAF